MWRSAFSHQSLYLYGKDSILSCSMFALVAWSQLLASRLATLAHCMLLESLCNSVF